MVIKKVKKSSTAGTNATIDQYFKIKTPTTTTITNSNVDENFNSQPIEDDIKPILTPERKIEKITKQIKRKPLAEITESSCTSTTFSMAISKKPSKPAFVVLRDEDIDNGVTEAQQPITTDKAKESITQRDSLWTQSINIGNTYNSQTSITSSPVHIFTQESIQKADNKNNVNKFDGDDDNNEFGICLDDLDHDDLDDDDDVDPFFDDLDDPFMKKTNKRRIPYSTSFSNKRQCPFSVPSSLSHTSNKSNRMLRNKSIFNENEDEEDEDEDEDDLFPADSLLFTSDDNSLKSGSMTSNSTRIDSTSTTVTDDQEKSDTNSTSAINKNNINSPKEIPSSPIMEYSISESMIFPIESHDDDDSDNDNDKNNNNEKENKIENSKNDLEKQDNTNDTPADINNKTMDDNDDEKENNKKNNHLSPSSPIFIESIRSTVSSPTKSTILSPISKSPLRSTHSSPIKSPFKSLLLSSSANASQLATLPISLPSDSSLDIHIAYPNPRGKSILEKFELSDN